MIYEEVIRDMYSAFNARDMEAVFEFLSDDIVWANGWEGGYVNGHEGIRDYWTRQWKVLDPRVEPVKVIQTADDTASVEVDQKVKDLEGKTVFDGKLMHYFTFTNGLISRFELEKLMTQ